MGDLSSVFFFLLVPALFTGGIVAAAVSAQQNGPTARFFRRHIRALYLLLGAFWALLAAYYFLFLPTQHGRVSACISIALSLCMFILNILSVFHRPPNPAGFERNPE
jgi:hypothetical protein